MVAKKVAALVFLVTLFAASPGTGLAEGSRNASMPQVYTGFNFRNYSDSNSDNVSTYTYLSSCYNANPNFTSYPIELELWRINNWAPDDEMTSRWHTGGAQTKFYGDYSSATYHFTLRNYNTDELWYNPLSCSTVNYGW